MSFEILPHTADVRLYISGQTLQELFSEALKGMNELMYEGFCKKQKKAEIQESFELVSSNSTTLLIDFLSLILTLSHTKKAIFCKVEFKKIEDTQLEGFVYGTHSSSFHEDIKAVTYSEAQVTKNAKGNFETVIVFDI